MPSFDEEHGWCTHCRCWVMLWRPGMNYRLHFCLSLLTLGLWLPFWNRRLNRRIWWCCPICDGQSTRLEADQLALQRMAADQERFRRLHARALD